MSVQRQPTCKPTPAARERVIEQALSRLLETSEECTVRAQRIAAAWGRGERGSDLDDLGRHELRPARRGVPLPLLGVLSLAAAAVMILVLVQRRSPSVPDPIDRPPPLTAQEQGELARLSLPLFPGRSGAGRPYALDAETVADEVRQFLDQHPAGWDAIVARARADFGREQVSPEGTQRLLFLLTVDRGSRSLELARELWTLAPERFDVEFIVAFADRGAPAFEQRLRTLLRDTAPGQVDSRLFASAWLATVGDTAAETILRNELAAAEAEEDLDSDTRAWIAALALAFSGDALVLQRRKAATRESVEEALAGRDVRRASRLVLAAKFFLAEGQAPRLELGSLPLRWIAYLAAQTPSMRTPDAIRRALDTL